MVAGGRSFGENLKEGALSEKKFRIFPRRCAKDDGEAVVVIVFEGRRKQLLPQYSPHNRRGTAVRAMLRAELSTMIFTFTQQIQTHAKSESTATSSAGKE